MTTFSAVLLLFLQACSGLNGHGIEGKIQGAANLQAVLEQSHFDRSNVAIGRASCDADGRFEIKLEKPFEEGLYRLSIGAKRMYFILDGKEQIINVDGNLETIDRMEVKIEGSATFNCYADIVKNLIANQLKSPEEAKDYINKGCTPLMQAFLTVQLLGSNPVAFMDEFRAQGKKLEEKMPDSKYTSDYKNMLTQVESQVNQAQAAELIKVGQLAPDITLPDPDGRSRSLSDLKGKVVLLDFWASWCGPCRRANPHVVELYKKYNARGFDVFSVSLDGADPRSGMSPEQMRERKNDGKRKWMEAIKKDGLLWDNHVSDLQHWGSGPASVYGVTAIPKTFLIGKDGKIVAVNPNQNLEEAIKAAL